jgi:hypothetical protein
MTGIIKVDTIQNNGGTTGLTIDSSGRVTLGVPVYVKCTGNNTSLSSTGSFDTLDMDTLVFQSGGFTLASDKVTVPVAGAYRYSFSIAKNFTSDRRAMSVMLQRNDSINVEEYNHYTLKHISGTTHGMLAGSGIVECAANDTVRLRVREYDSNNGDFILREFSMDLIG